MIVFQKRALLAMGLMKAYIQNTQLHIVYEKGEST